MKKFLSFILALLIIATAGGVLFLNFNDTEYIVTVDKVERVTYSVGGGSDFKVISKYLVYCFDENGEPVVFENSDNILRGKLNSSDMYALIKEGEKYKFTVIGIRLRFFSSYQNIIKVEQL